MTRRPVPRHPSSTARLVGATRRAWTRTTRLVDAATRVVEWILPVGRTVPRPRSQVQSAWLVARKMMIAIRLLNKRPRVMPVGVCCRVDQMRPVPRTTPVPWLESVKWRY